MIELRILSWIIMAILLAYFVQGTVILERPLMLSANGRVDVSKVFGVLLSTQFVPYRPNRALLTIKAKSRA